MSKPEEEVVNRWTAKRRSALVLGWRLSGGKQPESNRPGSG